MPVWRIELLLDERLLDALSSLAQPGNETFHRNLERYCRLGKAHDHCGKYLVMYYDRYGHADFVRHPLGVDGARIAALAGLLEHLVQLTAVVRTLVRLFVPTT